MLSNSESDGNELIQLGDGIPNQDFDENHDQEANNSNSSNKNNLYNHVIQLSNFLKTINSSNSMKENDVKQVLHIISKIFSDLDFIKKIPSSEIDPQLLVNESYKILAYSLYLLIQNQNIDFLKDSNGNASNLNENDSFENSSDLISFLAEEYDLPRNLSQKEIISSIKEHKRNENSLSPKKEKEVEIQSLKNKIERLQNFQKENDAALKERINALAITNEVQKKEILNLQKQNKTLQSKADMAMVEALNITKSPFPDNYDDINRARVNLLENDIKSIKNQYDQLKEKKHKLSAENKQLKNDIQKLIENGKRKDSQIIEYKRSLAELKIENEQLATNNDIKSLLNSNDAEIKLKDGENKKLSNALNEISNHFKSLSSEISIESNRSNVLYELTQKLLIATNKYDSLLNEKEKEASRNQILLNEYQSTISQLQETQIKNEKHNEQIKENGQTIEEIKKYLTNKNLPENLNGEILQIIENDGQTTSKVVSLIDFILEKSINKQEYVDTNINLEKQNERLIEFCSSLLQFFEQLANSGEMQQWIIGSPQDESFRPLLLAQCNKIESFLQQYNSELDLKYSDFFNMPSRIENIINDEIHPQSREIILLFQLCSTVNDALRRYAINLNDANHALVNDIHELRHEIHQVSNECVFTFDEIQKSRNSSSIQTIEPPKSLNPKLEEVMNIIQKSNSEKVDETIEKIISILNPKSASLSNEKIQSLLKENSKLKEVNDQLMQQNNEINTTIKMAQKESAELKKKEKSFQTKISQLQEIINDQESQITIIQESHENYELVKNDNSDQISKLNDEIENLKMKCSTLENEKKSQKSSLKSAYSKNLQKLQKENEELKSQIEKQKNHYEQMIENEQTKLKESVENESKLTNELKNSNLNLKKISSDLSAIKVENKLLNLRISASDEKMQREKNLLETHFRMNKLNLETKHEAEIQNLKAEFDKQFHDFLVSICERFKDFFDFNQPISDSSVQSLLFNVGNELKREKERLAIFELYSNEMNTVRSILGINDSEPVVPVISKIVEKLNNINNEKRLIEVKEIPNNQLLNDQTAAEWEQWAKKLILMVSDNFISAKSSKNLQFAIEEAVMVGISQRGLIKKIGILRSEKFLLKNGKIYIKGRNRKLSLNTLLLVFACIRRLQINSGHLPSTISTNNRNDDIQTRFINENRDGNDNFTDNIAKSSKNQKITKRNYPIIPPI